MSNTTTEFPVVPNKIWIIGIWALLVAHITLTFDSDMSAMIAAYSGKKLRVLENQDPRLSPWIDLNDMKRSGYLEVAVQKEGLMAPDVLSIPYQLRSRQPASSASSSTNAAGR